MKRGFLNNSRKGDNDLGPLRDARSGRTHNPWHREVDLGEARRNWSISSSQSLRSDNTATPSLTQGWHAPPINPNWPETFGDTDEQYQHSEHDNTPRNTILPDSRADDPTVITMSTEAASSVSSVTAPSTISGVPSSNPFKGQAFLPHKTEGVPRAALAAWYSKRPRCHQVSKDSYITWNDSNMPHLLKFTSVFVCPLSGEVFATGRYGDPALYEVKLDPFTQTLVVWYNKKTLAEHGAAARAFDCWSLREHVGTTTRSVHIGDDDPYLSSEHAKLPTFPRAVQQEIEKRIQLAQNRMNIDVPTTSSVLTEDDDGALQRERDEYRAARSGQIGEVISVATMMDMDDQTDDRTEKKKDIPHML